MLNRQKSILYMMENAGRPVTHLEITKWAFLLAHETFSRGGSSFYQFLPYKWGPFSFCLYREIDTLVHDGFLADRNNTWHIVKDVVYPTDNLSQRVLEDVKCIVQRFQNMTRKALTDYVYEQFPWFTVNSNIRKLEIRPVAPVAVFTIGYEGLLVDGFLNNLISDGIQRLIDIRNNPVARRYGFHKRTLARLCSKVQIEYMHFPQLGIPSKWRQCLKSKYDYEELFAKYEKEILTSESETVIQVAKMITERPTALMCLEADPTRCHRSRLANMISHKTGMIIRHLG